MNSTLKVLYGSLKNHKYINTKKLKDNLKEITDNLKEITDKTHNNIYLHTEFKRLHIEFILLKTNVLDTYLEQYDYSHIIKFLAQISSLNPKFYEQFHYQLFTEKLSLPDMSSKNNHTDTK